MYATCYVTANVPVAPTITGITLVLTVHMPSVYIVRSAYSRISLASFLITFLSSPEIATSITRHVPLSVSWIMMSGLFLGMVLPICTCRVHNVVTVPPGLVSADFGTWSHHSSLVIVAHFLAHTHSVMSHYGLLCCQYWALWCYAIYCFVKILP